MATFNWSPGIGDPTFMGWLTVVLYFLAVLGCWTTAQTLSSMGSSAGGINEIRAWRWVAGTFVALGFNKQLDLQTALTEVGRAFAHHQGWYDQRQPIQVAFIVLIAVICLTAAIILVRWAREAPFPTWVALLGSISVICFVFIRAASFHHIDRLIGGEVLGWRWNWILEIGGISVVLGASCWRRRVPAAQSRPHSAGTTGSRSHRRRDFRAANDQLPSPHRLPDGYTAAPSLKELPGAQIWLTYSELSELLKCELSDLRQAVIDNEWSQRKSRDGLLRVKLSPALAHQYMLNYVAGLGHELMQVEVNSLPTDVSQGSNWHDAPASASIRPPTERRSNPRRQITTEAMIRLEPRSVACTVRDLSSVGAGLALPDTIPLPAEFDLTLGEASRRCLTVWRQLDRMGVKLQSGPFAS
jgi:hypothetical protein